jgi:hypothetical protein
LSGTAITLRSLRLNLGFGHNHTASRKSIETVNGGSRRTFCDCSRRRFSCNRSPKVQNGVGNRDNLRGILRSLLHCCNTCGANEDESRRECGDTLVFRIDEAQDDFLSKETRYQPVEAGQYGRID